MIEVMNDAPLNTIQDLGRPLSMTMGVSQGGAMDPMALMLGNALLGNAPDAAGVEIALFPFRVRFERSCAFALTGARGPARLDDMLLPPDWAMPAQAGQVLTIGPPVTGTRAYLTLSGGLDVPVVLGARATDGKGGFGGLDGRGLRKGDQIGTLPATASLPPACGFGLATPCPLPEGRETTVQVIWAAEHERFTPRAQARFVEHAWRVSPSANRTGFRLEGEEALALDTPLSLFSHGIVPGTVQVPPAGQPIVQMADANTCGGYPKIATVIECDLRLLAQTRIGAFVRFEHVDRAAAITRLRAEARALDARIAAIVHLRRSLAT